LISLLTSAPKLLSRSFAVLLAGRAQIGLADGHPPCGEGEVDCGVTRVVAAARHVDARLAQGAVEQAQRAELLRAAAEGDVRLLDVDDVDEVELRVLVDLGRASAFWPV